MATTFGNVRQRGDGFDLDFERLLATDLRDAWSAMTEPERLARWMARYEGTVALGGQWRAYADDGDVFVRGVITAGEAPYSFTTTWHAVEEEPTELVVTLTELAGGAHRIGLRTSPRRGSRRRRDRAIAGRSARPQ